MVVLKYWNKLLVSSYFNKIIVINNESWVYTFYFLIRVISARIVEKYIIKISITL